MKLKEIYNTASAPKISFEVFPPKEDLKCEKLIEELKVLKKYSPSFVSLTWGAGGNGQSSTNFVNSIKSEGFDVMPHFTCVCNSREFVSSHIKKLKRINIDKILALRGDLPQDKSLICKEFSHANELVEFLKNKSDLSIGVAGYPEGHIEADTLENDIKYLKLKIDAGADAVFTQLFFDNNKFFRYVERVRKEKINIPVIPGIMPIISKKQIEKMISIARITVPKKLETDIEKFGNSNSDMQKMGVEYAVKQCENLIHEGVCGLHFFTLNKSKSTSEILENII